MPYLQLITNVQLDEEKQNALVRSLSKVTVEALRKQEAYMSVSYDYNSSLIFGGTSDPCFQLTLTVVGLTPDMCPGISAVIAAELKSKLGLHPSRGYMSFVDPPLERMGFAGTTLIKLFPPKQKL